MDNNNTFQNFNPNDRSITKTDNLIQLSKKKRRTILINMLTDRLNSMSLKNENFDQSLVEQIVIELEEEYGTDIEGTYFQKLISVCPVCESIVALLNKSLVCCNNCFQIPIEFGEYLNYYTVDNLVDILSEALKHSKACSRFICMQLIDGSPFFFIA